MNQPNLALTVALPAYEEAESLAKLLPALKDVLSALNVPSEVLVVDTEAPRDRTVELCASLGVRCVPRRGGSYYGNAIRTAFAEARGERLIVMDADGSHDPEFIVKLWEKREQADLLVASRYVAGGHTDNPAALVWLSRGLNAVFQQALSLKCADVSNSFRLYRTADVTKLKLVSDHFDLVEEILVKLLLAAPDYRVLELPASFSQRTAGKTKRQLLTFSLGYARTLWRLRRMQRRAQRTGAVR